MAKDQPNEAESGNALVAQTMEADRMVPKSVMIGGQAFAVKQAVKVPTLKHDSGVTVAVRIEQPIRHEISTREQEVILADGEVVKGKVDGKIAVVRVTELSSNQLFNLVLNAISASEFERAYATDANGVPGYVGKSFAIHKMGVVAGKRYKDVQIVEIEPTLA